MCIRALGAVPGWVERGWYLVTAFLILPQEYFLRPGYADIDLPLDAYRRFNKIHKQHLMERKHSVYEKIVARWKSEGSLSPLVGSIMSELLVAPQF